MRIVQASSTVLALLGLLVGQARAAGMKHWSNNMVHLSLTYPGAWHAVAERGATLKLLAPDAAGEFEIFSLPASLSPGKLTTRIDSTLAQLHCAVAVRHASGSVGHLGIGGPSATGTCTGADQGWKLTVTAFNYRSRAVLLRSWLFHGQHSDHMALAAIASSLSTAP